MEKGKENTLRTDRKNIEGSEKRLFKKIGQDLIIEPALRRCKLKKIRMITNTFEFTTIPIETNVLFVRLTFLFLSF